VCRNGPGPRGLFPVAGLVLLGKPRAAYRKTGLEVMPCLGEVAPWAGMSAAAIPDHRTMNVQGPCVTSTAGPNGARQLYGDEGGLFGFRC
jgi:hypothetical protein